MRRRITLSALLLLGACTSAHQQVALPWVEFRFAPGWGAPGWIKGDITSTGAVHVEATRDYFGPPFTRFEKQLRPAEMGRIRNAIAAHLAHFGQGAGIRTGTMDASELWIIVKDGDRSRVSFHLASPCHQDGERHEYVLWNEIMRATRAPEYDTRAHLIECP